MLNKCTMAVQFTSQGVSIKNHYNLLEIMNYYGAGMENYSTFFILSSRRNVKMARI